MTRKDADPRVVHIFDCADVGATLVRTARAQGRPWSYLPARDTSQDGKELRGRLKRLGGVAGWTARRWSLTLPADFLHIHFGTRVDIATRWPQRPYIVHFHGTDIREFYNDPRQRPKIQWGADHAAAVVYSTPDLRKHAEPVRSDAVYLPNPVDWAELPEWTPAGPPRVVFASRWEDSKGGAEQLKVAAAIRDVTQGRVVLEGLDWGNMAEEARALGVRLVPKMPKAEYLRWMSGAHCVVGQSAGILAMSELQALSMGVPVVMNLGEGYYVDAPVLDGDGPEGLAAQALRALEDPLAVSAQANARAWVEKYHGPDAAVEKLAGIYRGVMAGR
ncbi:glycosyltransferase family 4 protein [Arthrobacter sp. QXT-31]|uniref:glycosyltransferase family 4 protein n=1 Tax=Arthrobacter sp. QXT-31 TaxID=1357915 RepID=UPI0012FA5B21|nr:glycosyltransferase family 4 protein [Arthrobacter sp. QXT-31]